MFHLFLSLDLYMYLDKEQLQEVIYLLLNRAVRYYGDIHDVLLDIIHILSGEFTEKKSKRQWYHSVFPSTIFQDKHSNLGFLKAVVLMGSPLLLQV